MKVVPFLLSYMLQSKGYVVKILSDANKLWAALIEIRPDLVLMDVFINNYSGFELCKAITSSQDAPVVILFSGISIFRNTGQGKRSFGAHD